MSAQEYYRDDARPLSPPTNAPHDAINNPDRRNTTDEHTGGAPERVTTPNFDNDKFDTSPSSPSHERNPSPLSDTSEYGRTGRGGYEEEGNNPYGKNYNMANVDSKEALVPGARRRTSGYQDLGTSSFFLLPSPSSLLTPALIRIRGGESSRSSGGATDGTRRQAGKVWSVDGEH